jgi:SAM-dependent methyltransferase
VALRAEYVTDVPYPRTFVPQIAPPTLRLVAAMNGLPCPPEEDFDYCELGCANGDSLALFAAANPTGRFVGVDLNPEHVAFAEGLAARARLSNVRFAMGDFEGLSLEIPHRAGTPPGFDFVVAHGVWSWVSSIKRDAVLAFAARALKPGGLLYLSYDALPGWASIEPLRRAMLDHTASMPGSSLDRAREGVLYLQRLADSGAGYFASHPTARSMLALMHSAGPAYVVHEYFHEHFAPMYFADVERALSLSGFSFVGQVPLHLNVRELATPPQIKKTADLARGRTEFEMLKDFASHELFRSDVYVKGQVTRDEKELRFYFEGTPFGTIAPAGQIKRECKLPFYTLDFKGPVYDAILGAISETPATAMELGQRKALSHLGQLRIGDCLRNLVLGGQVVPMRARETTMATSRLLGPYNDVALGDALEGGGPLVLASPATGTGVHLSLLEGLALRALTDDLEGGALAPWLRQFAARRGTPIVIGDRSVKDGDELVRIMPREVERLRAALPRLARLGVVDGPAPGAG